ncbi:MAG: hypothetical protein ACTSWV_02710 [Candidatus Asgardarchaeia archaeon]
MKNFRGTLSMDEWEFEEEITIDKLTNLLESIVKGVKESKEITLPMPFMESGNVSFKIDEPITLELSIKRSANNCQFSIKASWKPRSHIAEEMKATESAKKETEEGADERTEG